MNLFRNFPIRGVALLCSALLCVPVASAFEFDPGRQVLWGYNPLGVSLWGSALGVSSNIPIKSVMLSP